MLFRSPAAMSVVWEVVRNEKKSPKLAELLIKFDTLDERICSGHYFANVFAYVTRMLADPHRMEIPYAEEAAAEAKAEG